MQQFCKNNRELYKNTRKVEYFIGKSEKESKPNCNDLNDLSILCFDKRVKAINALCREKENLKKIPKKCNLFAIKSQIKIKKKEIEKLRIKVLLLGTIDLLLKAVNSELIKDEEFNSGN